MRESGSHPTRLRFGVFEVDLRTGELSRRGLRLRLQEQPFRVLAMLVERPGQLVTRDEIRDRLWSRTVVDFDHGINKAINKIRDALGDSAEHPRFVETVARRGYRFVADVTVLDRPPPALDPPPGRSDAADGGETDDSSQTVDATAATAPVATDTAPTPPSSRRWSWRAPAAWRLAATAALVAAAAVAALVLHRDAAPAIRSLAVLPLGSVSPDGSPDWLADGITDALINDLGRIGALRVISRTSAMTYKGAHKPLPQIARELGVDAVVEGTVVRAGERVRVNLQLVRVPEERHLWAQSYEGEVRDALTLQRKVARAIAEQVQATLSAPERAALARSKAVDPTAYEAYLKGRYFWNKRTVDALQTALGFFDRAIAADPAYAEAHSGLADSYALLGDWEYGALTPHDALPKAKAAALRALALDDSLAEAHTSLAFVLDLYDWDWAAAEREFVRAIALKPGYATAHHWYAWHLLVTGRAGDGIAELERARSLDPLSLIIGADLADALTIAHRYDEAIAQSRRIIELDPRFAVAHFQLGQALGQTGRHEQAIDAIRRAIELGGTSAALESSLAYTYALAGRRDEAQQILQTLQHRQPRLASTDAAIAAVYAGLGDTPRALEWLDKAYEARFNPSILLRPPFERLRGQPGFQDLLRRIGLPPHDPADSAPLRR